MASGSVGTAAAFTFVSNNLLRSLSNVIKIFVSVLIGKLTKRKFYKHVFQKYNL